MKRLLTSLPALLILLAASFLLVHGPIPQLAHYHEFADQSVWLGVPHAADVFSNIGFFAIATWGIWRLWPMREHPALKAGWPGYRLFLIGLLLTAIGSSFYHVAPDNARLIWDRLPIALACAGLLAAVRAETQLHVNGNLNAAWLALFAIASVVWWFVTEQVGAGDLRPYLLLQGLPLILIPLWQAIYRAPRADRLAFATALLLYVAAKAAEINDYQLLDISGVISGHTIKHLLATAAAGILVCRLVNRVR
ncbi:MAG: hypothetical protein ACXU7D_05795 [Burkholderiaceae bacterium]